MRGWVPARFERRRFLQVFAGLAPALSLPAIAAAALRSTRTKENPLDTERVKAKARALTTPVLGRERTEALIARVGALDQPDSIRTLIPLLSTP
jgi:hypothetical protein